MKSIFKYTLLSMILSWGLVACGGGGGSGDDNGDSGAYNGATGAARVSMDNSDDLTLAAVSGIKAAVSEDLIPDSIPSGSSRPEGAVNWKRLASRTANQPVEGVCRSGSVDVTSTENGSGTAGTVTMVFDNCTYDDTDTGETVTIDGTMEYVFNEDHSFSVTIHNMTVTSSYGTERMAYYHMACDADFNCTWTTDVAGIDGRTYRIENAQIYGTAMLDGSLTVYDPDYGAVEVIVEGVLYECATGVPSAGSIMLTGEGGSSASVLFNDCNSFTVTVDGESTTYNWADILGG